MPFWRRSTRASEDPDGQGREGIPPRVRAAKEERQRQLAGQTERVASIERVLFAEDPIGISFEQNLDEYRPEAETITLRLPEASTETEFLRIVHEEFVAWFGESVAGPLTHYESIAAQIWDLHHGEPGPA